MSLKSKLPSQLLTLSNRIPQLVFRDFITGLPPEITLLILRYLDGRQLVLCCQVSKAWNRLISNIGGLWRSLAQQAGASVDYYDKEYFSAEKCPQLNLKESNGPVLAKLHKSLYLQTLKTLRGLSTGAVLNLHPYIDKGQWRITAVKYHNGTVVTGCDDHTVQSWSVPDGAPLSSVSTHSVCCLTIRGNHLYTASFNANAESWDIVTGRHLRTFCGHTSAVLAIDVTADETFMVTGSVDRTAKLWDLRPPNAVLLRTLNSIHEDWVFQVKFLHSSTDVLSFLTCDSSLCNLWQTNLDGDVIASHHVNSDGSSKFTSFFHFQEDTQVMFACQWEEWSKSSWISKYEVHHTKCSIEKNFHVQIPLEAVKAYILGAGQRFAVIMCSISRKDFHVFDLQTKNIVSRITTPDFCMLTRNGSTVTLCDTRWLDGFIFEDLREDRPLFAACVGQNTVLLGTWASKVRQLKQVQYDSEV
ncbi:F-box/WD repeat-containing protein 2 [Elysia marginata]|uniref:F-box/WD repeat-containing protein 2 n=1 Tax=Elysia marginata TaxID=1093978 RepID=A0AAV4GV68_9GAST|nr:F-box/WD repeat-containing protein 2 [Elysia marginata]